MEWDSFTTDLLQPQNLIISTEPESEFEFISDSQEMNRRAWENHEFLKRVHAMSMQMKEAILLEENSENCSSAIKEILKGMPEKLPKVPQLLLGNMEKNSKAQKSYKMNDEQLWLEITEAYRPTDAEPGQSVTAPEPKLPLDVNTLEQIVPMLKKDNQVLDHLENYNLRNAYKLGWWLNIAFAIFQKNKKNLGMPSFKEWCLQKVDIKDSRQRDLRNLATLIDKAPKLVRCHLPVSFFTKNNRALMELIEKMPVGWTHELPCLCKHCKC